MNGLDLQSQRIINLASPSTSTDATNKQYVDNLLLGGSKWKDPVRLATTTNGTLATAYANGQSIDGVALVTGDRILIKDQSAGAENGIYVVAATGAPARAIDADSAVANAELSPGTTVYVTEGTVNGDKAFAITSNAAVTIGTTATTWGQIGGGSQSFTASNGVNLTSSNFSGVAAPSGGLTVGASGFAIDTSVVSRKFSANVGNGTLTSIPITHNLGTQDIVVSVREVSTNSGVLTDWVATDTNIVTLTFATAPASNAFRVTVVG